MSLFDNLKDVKGKLVSDDNIRTENFIFKLHYVWTVTLLLTFSIILSLSQYAGDPIDCLVKDSIQPDDGPQTFDSYCWVEGTYTRKDEDPTAASSSSTFKELNGEVSVSSPLKKVRCLDHPDTKDPKTDCWKHTYYQWVALVLVAQAGCFYLPRYLWQIWEEGKIKGLVSGLDRRTLVRGLQTRDALAKGELNAKLGQIISYWREARGTNNVWAAKYYTCELLNMLNVILQFFFTNYFLAGQFGRVALDGIHLKETSSVLPILTECLLEKYGQGGGEEKIYGLCVLPLNMVNQKFYVIFWFWLSTLQVLSVAALAYRVIVVFSSEAKDFILKYRYGIKDFNRSIIATSSHGDWFLLTSLLNNMNGLVGSFFLVELGKLKEYDAYSNFQEEQWKGDS